MVWCSVTERQLASNYLPHPHTPHKLARWFYDLSLSRTQNKGVVTKTFPVRVRVRVSLSNIFQSDSFVFARRHRCATDWKSTKTCTRHCTFVRPGRKITLSHIKSTKKCDSVKLLLSGAKIQNSRPGIPHSFAMSSHACSFKTRLWWSFMVKSYKTGFFS